MAEQTITNPAGAFGYSADVLAKGPHTYAELITTAAVADRRVVAVSGTGSTGATAGITAQIKAIGIADGAAAVGRSCRVVTYGPVDLVPADGAIADGAVVKASTTTAGSVITGGVTAAGEVLGFALGAAAGGFVTVFVTKGS